MPKGSKLPSSPSRARSITLKKIDVSLETRWRTPPHKAALWIGSIPGLSNSSRCGSARVAPSWCRKTAISLARAERLRTYVQQRGLVRLPRILLLALRHGPCTFHAAQVVWANVVSVCTTWARHGPTLHLLEQYSAHMASSPEPRFTTRPRQT